MCMGRRGSPATVMADVTVIRSTVLAGAMMEVVSADGPGIDGEDASAAVLDALGWSVGQVVAAPAHKQG